MTLLVRMSALSMGLALAAVGTARADVDQDLAKAHAATVADNTAATRAAAIAAAYAKVRSSELAKSKSALDANPNGETLNQYRAALDIGTLIGLNESDLEAKAAALVTAQKKADAAAAATGPSSDLSKAARQKAADANAALNKTVAQASGSETSCLDSTTREGDGCFTAGPIVVPFKLELTGKKEVLAGANIGGTLGYKFTNVANSGLSPDLLVFAGVSNNLNSNLNGNGVQGASSSTASTFFSYGVGVSFDTGGLLTSASNGSRFHVGLLLGKDHTKANSYAYNEKLWMSVLAGVTF